MVFAPTDKMLSATEFFALHEKKRSYGGKALPPVPFQHLDYMELAADYADYVCQHEKFIGDDPSMKNRERIANMSPEAYDVDLKLVYGGKPAIEPEQ